MSDIYPKLNEDKAKFMLDKQKVMREKLTHYKKIKKKWSVANTVLKSVVLSITCLLGGAAILTVTPFALPIVAAILGGVSIGNQTLGHLVIEGYTSKQIKKFQHRCEHIPSQTQHV